MGLAAVRLEAFTKATEIVDTLAPRLNSRGYADGTLGPQERASLIIKVADWLLEGAEADQDLAAEVARLKAEAQAAISDGTADPFNLRALHG